MVTVQLGKKKRTFKSYAEAAKAALNGKGLDYMVFYMRLRRGWSVKDAFTLPLGESPKA